MHKWYVTDAPFTSLWNSTNTTGVHKFSKNLKTVLPEVKHEASCIQGSTNMTHHHTKSGHHGYLDVVNTSASHSKVLILYLDLEIIIFKVYIIFPGPDRQTPSQYLKTDDNSSLLHCSMHNLQPLYYKALIMTYKSQEVLLNKPNTPNAEFCLDLMLPKTTEENI